jgi:hypothetical protein
MVSPSLASRDPSESSPAHLNVGFQLLDGQTVEGGYGFIVLADSSHGRILRNLHYAHCPSWC